MAHVTLLSVAGAIAYHFTQARERREAESRTPAGADAIAIELPMFAEGTLVTDHEVVPEGEVPVAHGGSTIARVDTGTLGRGGSSAGARAINLAALDEELSLSPDLISRLDRDQHQRLKTTAKPRTTREDRRATTNPMELTFLATGTGEHQERRPRAISDPSRGSLIAPRPPSVVGGHAGTRESDAVEGPGATAGADRRGQLTASPGVGVRAGEAGTHHDAAARIAQGRPSVAEGPPTITASLRGEVFDWYTNDPMLLPYFRQIHAKVDPLWRDAFPRSALLELKQGTVIIEFTIAADGSVRVSWPPARPSGIDEFDKNCADAIRRAGPFAPIPAALREMGRSSLRIRAPFVAKNPIVK